MQMLRIANCFPLLLSCQEELVDTRKGEREIGTFDRQMESSNSLQVAWAAALVIMGLISKEQGLSACANGKIKEETEEQTQ